ncbi:MAG TPA: inositol monophosphatase family protein [bacterium]|nr:inositol monophosphatase family protein [bacterium]
MPDFSQHALTALRAAGAAGTIQRLLLGKTRVDYKGPQDPVTEADRSCENAIVGILHEAFPSHAFVGEEGGRRGNADYTWLIDPLDGTHNYAHAFPWFAASIALRRGDEVVCGVILNTMLREIYVAERGAGAYAAPVETPYEDTDWTRIRTWRRMRVSPIDRLEDATLCTGFRHPIAPQWLNLDHFTNLLARAARVREIGSAALALAAVAQGQTEGYWEIGPHEWDFAAGMLLITEAGGRTTDLRGRHAGPDRGQLLATNGVIHEQVVAVLAQGRSAME